MNVNPALLLLVCSITSTYGQLYADDVSDGRCTLNPVPANITLCLPYIFTPRVYTVNFASASLLRNYAESFLGRPAKDQAELDAMCYTFALIETLVIQVGYRDKANFRTAIPTELDPTKFDPLSPFGLGKLKIEKTLAQTPGSYVTNQFMTIDQALWCDSKNVLLVRCVNGTRQDWKLASIGDPEPWVKPIVLKIITDLGMPPENALEYRSVANGGTCPVVPDLISYTLHAAKAVAPFLPIP